MNTLTVQQVIAVINAPAVDAFGLLMDLDYTPAPMSIAEWAAQAAQSNEPITLWHWEIVSGIYAGQITTAEFDAIVAEVKASL